ncbi:MAG: MauE/DoxX family redox-associated membrane protein [Syntrophobacteria bacterium]
MTEEGGKKRGASWLSHPNAALAARVVLGCVFIYASLDKIRHPDLFAEAVYNYQLLPEVAVNLVAVCLPWLELLSGVLLILGLWVRGSVLVLSGLLLVFLGALGINLARGLDIHCGCFTTQSAHTMTVLDLFRDFLFLLLAFYLFWLHQIRGIETRFSLAQVLKR